MVCAGARELFPNSQVLTKPFRRDELESLLVDVLT